MVGSLTIRNSSSPRRSARANATAPSPCDLDEGRSEFFQEFLGESKKGGSGVFVSLFRETKVPDPFTCAHRRARVGLNMRSSVISPGRPRWAPWSAELIAFQVSPGVGDSGIGPDAWVGQHPYLRRYNFAQPRICLSVRRGSPLGFRAPRSSAKRCGKRRAPRQFSTAVGQRHADDHPRFPGRLGDRTGVFGGPAAGSGVMGVGPFEDFVDEERPLRLDRAGAAMHGVQLREGHAARQAAEPLIDGRFQAAPRIAR